MKSNKFNPSEKYQNTIKTMVDLFDFWNKVYFNSELEVPVITVNYSRRDLSMGWFVSGKAWKDMESGEGSVEINISPQYLDLPFEETADTMLHEMCHYYCYLNGIAETSRSGYYHNKKFKKVAETHGLKVEKTGNANGWAYTELTENSKALLKKFERDEKFICSTGNRETKPNAHGQEERASSTRKYICPCCRTKIRATRVVRVICADCQIMFQEVKENSID